MSGKQWLTIEDWFDCDQLLCPLDIRHSGRIERTKPDFIQTIFVSCKLGARVLYDGKSQVSILHHKNTIKMSIHLPTNLSCVRFDCVPS